jgi:hypothetical protein
MTLCGGVGWPVFISKVWLPQALLIWRSAHDHVCTACKSAVEKRVVYRGKKGVATSAWSDGESDEASQDEEALARQMFRQRTILKYSHIGTACLT